MDRVHKHGAISHVAAQMFTCQTNCLHPQRAIRIPDEPSVPQAGQPCLVGGAILLVCYYEKNIKSDGLEQSHTNACQAGVKSSAHQSFGSDINPVREKFVTMGLLGCGNPTDV